ncbi:uncharacterized protein VTP21DRAFT_6877 [Calcarisporiella thermophila]|uniref:uncharacterized protein n=1 Tax=Calcarisporiella thermophila TaxID=911321 RepID=UPI003742DC04
MGGFSFTTVERNAAHPRAAGHNTLWPRTHPFEAWPLFAARELFLSNPAWHDGWARFSCVHAPVAIHGYSSHIPHFVSQPGSASGPSLAFFMRVKLPSPALKLRGSLN